MFITVLAINCGDILTNSTGWISPPDTDGDGLYGFRTDCVWVIRVPDHKSLQIHFNEMDIEEGLMCGYDYVRVSSLTNEPGHRISYTTSFAPSKHSTQPAHLRSLSRVFAGHSLGR